MLVSHNGETQTTNLFGLNLIHQDDGTTVRTLLADGLGSVRVEMAGNVIDSAATYEPYGKLLARTGDSGAVYGYTGEQHDAATGLVYLRARYYNPNLKIFMSRDPFPGWPTLPASQHGYSYVHNNPVNLIDPTGEFALPLPAAFALPAIPPALLITGVVVAGIAINDLVIAPLLGTPAVTPALLKALGALLESCSTGIQQGVNTWRDIQRVSTEIWRQPQNRTQTRPQQIPGPYAPPIPTPDRGQKRILTVGDGDFGYSRSLANRYPDWDITGTNFGDGSNRQTFIRREGNLSLYAHVDATRLESGAVTGLNRYDAIIFNNPYLGAGGSQTASLIAGFKQSARGQLSPVGAIHINVTQKLLENHIDVARELGLPNNHPDTVRGVRRFGHTIYYAPYTPHYTSGDPMLWYREDPTRVSHLKNFVFR